MCHAYLGKGRCRKSMGAVWDLKYTFMPMLLPNGSGLIQKNSPCCIAKKEMFRNCFRNFTKSLLVCLLFICWFGLQIPQISVWLSIPGMCWTNRSDLLRHHSGKICRLRIGTSYHSIPSESMSETRAEGPTQFQQVVLMFLLIVVCI